MIYLFIMSWLILIQLGGKYGKSKSNGRKGTKKRSNSDNNEDDNEENTPKKLKA